MAKFSSIEGALPISEIKARVAEIQKLRRSGYTLLASEATLTLYHEILVEIGNERMRYGWASACLEALRAEEAIDMPFEEKKEERQQGQIENLAKVYGTPPSTSPETRAYDRALDAAEKRILADKDFVEKLTRDKDENIPASLVSPEVVSIKADYGPAVNTILDKISRGDLGLEDMSAHIENKSSVSPDLRSDDEPASSEEHADTVPTPSDPAFNDDK